MFHDSHCHFFSSRFLELLAPQGGGAAALAARVGWDDPGPADALADRWVGELDRHGVGRAVLIASVPGDEDSVAAAVARHAARFVGFFMHNPAAPGADEARRNHLASGAFRGVCLFPAMHGYRIDGDDVRRVFADAASHQSVVFVHCGALTVGIRKRLDLPSRFDWRLGDPLAVSRVALEFPGVPVIIPHFGAGFFREALMAADQCPTVHLDTSSSNGWMRYHPGLALDAVFRQALAVAGADRLLFGTDSSFFPRGWQRGIYEAQQQALERAGADERAAAAVFGGTFERLFGRTV
jgi:predicted TIM-barrel fold metal-dependent hydrolase